MSVNFSKFVTPTEQLIIPEYNNEFFTERLKCRAPTKGCYIYTNIYGKMNSASWILSKLKNISAA